MKTTKIEVRNRRELDDATRSYRNNGYNIITFGTKMRELENEEQIVVITIK